ncbi:MAG: hypothetical protein ABSE25_02365 [Syntrophorhabdales bacterium]
MLHLSILDPLGSSPSIDIPDPVGSPSAERIIEGVYGSERKLTIYRYGWQCAFVRLARSDKGKYGGC